MSALLSTLLGALAGALGKIAEAFFAAWNERKARADSDATHERAGAAEAANETQQTITEVADARAQIDSAPDDADALARRLRERAAADRAAGRSG